MRELAGAYYSGDGLGRNTTLTIGADGRFSFVWHGCMGKYDETRGTVRLEGGRVRLTLENAPAMAWDRWEGLGDDLWTVPWGPRLYLVPDKGLAGFVDQIHGRWEPRDSAYGPYYLRREDWEKPVSGTPTLPGEWSQRILDHPVPGQVTEALNDGRWRVDIGRRAGAFVGMGLVSPRHSPLFPHLRIVEVNDDSSVVELYGPGDAAPRVGNKVLGGRSR